MDIQGLGVEELVSRLKRLVGDERRVVVEFLLHLGEFDVRRAYIDEGCASLWAYCERKLGHRDGAIFLRINAARLLRRFPYAEEFLADGRLSMTSLADLREVLTEENALRLFAEASGRSSDDVKRIARSILPKTPRAEGIRKLPAPRVESENSPALSLSPDPLPLPLPLPLPSRSPLPLPLPLPTPTPVSSPAEDGVAARFEFLLVTPAAPRRAKVEPVSGTKSQIVMVVDLEFLARLTKAQAILSHGVPNGDPAAIFSKGIDLIIEKHERRVGEKKVRARKAASVTDSSVTPTSATAASGTIASATRASVTPASVTTASATTASVTALPVVETRETKAARRSARKAIPAAVFREVWKRDGGVCQWKTEGGHGCGSDYQTQGDHKIPVAWGGESTVENVRIYCRRHNLEHARRCFGGAWMDRFSGKAATSASRSDGPTSVVRNDAAGGDGCRDGDRRR